MKKNNNKENKKPSAERVLRWLGETNDFVNKFLSPKERLNWKKVKNQPIKRPLT